jgi:Ribulose-5-phosphate 4-epimerase and related epimerases and aldolases
MLADLRKAEWKIRTELAAAYRLVALFGWDDLVFTHLSARVPGPGAPLSDQSLWIAVP